MIRLSVSHTDDPAPMALTLAGSPRPFVVWQGLLAEVYEGGHGVDRDEARAGQLRRKGEG